MTRVFIVRHAEAEGNLYRRVHGWYDSRLTADGFRQLSCLADRFAGEKIDAVYASDLRRTRETAMALAAPRGLPVVSDARLREIGMGVWEDKPWGEVIYRQPDMLYAYNDEIDRDLTRRLCPKSRQLEDAKRKACVLPAASGEAAATSVTSAAPTKD